MQYSVQGTDGNTYGPVDLITLKQWAGEGRVLPNSKITDHLSNQTMLASQMTELGMSIPSNPYANTAPPPANFSSYPRTEGQAVKSEKTQLWTVIIWLGVAVVISLFTRVGGVITSGLTILDAVKAKSNNDKHGNLCLAIAIIGFLLILGWTMLKASMAAPTN